MQIIRKKTRGWDKDFGMKHILQKINSSLKLFTISDSKYAFTLAEVLITLAIIGVVAAMTLPTVINNTKRKEYSTGLKKAYSTLEQVLQLMAYDEGQPITPSNYAAHKFVPVFIKYIPSKKSCTDWCLIDRNGEFDDEGNLLGLDFGDYKTYNKKNTIAGHLMDNGQLQLRDGMTIYIENEGPTYISVDINGMYKKPNLWGHDLFTFQLMPSGKILPMGATGTDYNATNYCSATSTSKLNGIACTNKALTEKDYFKNLPR